MKGWDSPSLPKGYVAEPSPVKGETKKMNLVEAIRSGLDIALQTDPTAVVFGEDVAFGGVFRCSVGLQAKYGKSRVFNTPLCEQGILGFGIGLAVHGNTAVAEIQFADYIHPAFDQVVNEAAKFRYRSCKPLPLWSLDSTCTIWSRGPWRSLPLPECGVLLRTHSWHHSGHSQRSESGQRAAMEDVPIGDYTLPLSQAEILHEGSDVTVIGYGAQIQPLRQACIVAKEQLGVSCELIDLRTIVPWDEDTVIKSVCKTGRVVVAHEDTFTGGFAGELISTVQAECFLNLEAPIQRVCSWDTPFPMVYEPFYVPSKYRCFEAIKKVVSF
eukprot:Em0023g294a